MAIDFFAHYVGNPFGRKNGIPIETEQFLLDSKCMDCPSDLDITFIDDETPYRFSFTVTPDLVQEEWIAVRSIDALESSVESTRVTDAANLGDYEWKFNPEHFVNNLYSMMGLVRPNTKLLNNFFALNTNALESSSSVFIRMRTAKLIVDRYWYRQIIELIDLLTEVITDAQASFFGKSGAVLLFASGKTMSKRTNPKSRRLTQC